MKQNYSDLLRDPRWQKKRLKILERDNWTCQGCGDKKSTLNVHHCYYENLRKPWDYPDSSLVTLCEDCHEYESKNFKSEIIATEFKKAGYLNDWLVDIAYHIHIMREKNTLKTFLKIQSCLCDKNKKFLEKLYKNMLKLLSNKINE